MQCVWLFSFPPKYRKNKYNIWKSLLKITISNFELVKCIHTCTCNRRLQIKTFSMHQCSSSWFQFHSRKMTTQYVGNKIESKISTLLCDVIVNAYDLFCQFINRLGFFFLFWSITVLFFNTKWRKNGCESIKYVTLQN